MSDRAPVAASINGVLPSASAASTLAPICRSSRTLSVLPDEHAMCSAVRPMLSAVSTDTPARSICRIVSESPWPISLMVRRIAFSSVLYRAYAHANDVLGRDFVCLLTPPGPRRRSVARCLMRCTMSLTSLVSPSSLSSGSDIHWLSSAF
ncbi:hypothetical protein IWW41_001941 [Coemansia sp. RSA 2522]|nr:hypothetical protein IWW41_001941 [Coemansia sp. RSA 2522]